MSSSPTHSPLITTALMLLAALAMIALPASASAQETQSQETSRERTRIEIERDRGDDEEPQAQRYERAEQPQSSPIADDAPPPDRPHWMFTVGRNAIWGGLIGGLLGVGVYMLTGFDSSPWIIAQFGGGGILVGAATGVVEAFVAPDLYALQPPSSVQWVQQEIPESFQLKVLELDF